MISNSNNKSSSSEADSNAVKNLFIINPSIPRLNSVLSAIEKANLLGNTQNKYVLLTQEYKTNGKIPNYDIKKIKELQEAGQQMYFYGVDEKKKKEICKELELMQANDNIVHSILIPKEKSLIEKRLELNINKKENKLEIKKYNDAYKNEQECQSASNYIQDREKTWKNYVDTQHEQMYGIDVGNVGMDETVKESFENRGYDVGDVGVNGVIENELENYYGQVMFYSDYIDEKNRHKNNDDMCI